MVLGRAADLRRLQGEFATAIAQVTLAMNEQFLAVVEESPDLAVFEARVDSAMERRRVAKRALMDHIKQHGW